MNQSGLDPLLQRPDVWRGVRRSDEQAVLPSGHAQLDKLLPGGGWPLGALTEICCGMPGMGELSLLLPALVRLHETTCWSAWVAPPHPLYPPALAAAGIDIERCLVIEPPQCGLRHAPARARQALWAAEQLLRGGACAAVLLWWDGEDTSALRRLQLAAESGRALAVLFRPESAAQRLSPACLRLRIDADGSFAVVKCRGGDWRAERGQRLRLLARQPRWRLAQAAMAGVLPTGDTAVGNPVTTKPQLGSPDPWQTAAALSPVLFPPSLVTTDTASRPVRAPDTHQPSVGDARAPARREPRRRW